MKKVLTTILASAVTLTAMTMAAASAWQRGDTTLDRALLVVVGCIIAAAVHLLPALLSRRNAWLVWPIWTLCFLVASYSHTWLFSRAADGAGEARAAVSSQARTIAETRQQIEAALAEIKARPVAVVAQLRARATMPERQQALDVELTEAHRAARMRDELISLASPTSVTAVTDPVTSRVTAVTGLTPEAVSLGVNLLMAVLVEVLGMLLWLEALRVQKSQVLAVRDDGEIQEKVQIVQPDPPSEIDRLRSAVSAGECSPTVSSIRVFLGCSQARAMQLRRGLMAGIAQA